MPFEEYALGESRLYCKQRNRQMLLYFCAAVSVWFVLPTKAAEATIPPCLRYSHCREMR